MNKIRLTVIVAALSLLATGLFPSNLMAWTPGYQFLAAGSSAQFNSVAMAALQPGAGGVNNTPCTGGVASNHWTSKSALGTSGMQIHDPRSTSIPDEPGSVWIGWNQDFINGMDGNVTGAGIICAYVSLDSTVGMREFFANGQMILNSPAGTADAGTLVPLLSAGVALPSEVVAFFATQPVINVAASDIRPEDAKFATIRAMDGPAGSQMTGNSYQALGYGGPVGTPIKGTEAGNKAMQVVDFVIDQTPPQDTDPFTGAVPRNYLTINIGAAPVLVIKNITNSAAGHLGDTNYQQINRYNLANVFSGIDDQIRQIGTESPQPAAYPLHVFIREPLSGTYNTFDFCITCSQERYIGFTGTSYNCQETNVNPASCPTPGASCGNPFFYTGYNGATRQRVIGTGDMVTAVSSTADGIGYAFWGYGNFSGKNSTLAYMPVDNLDPLYASPSANTGGVGYFPQCSSLPCGVIPFTNVKNGTYPIWSMYRWVYDQTDPHQFENGILTYLDPAAGSYVEDFVPASQMSVFRSHFTQVVRTDGVATYPSNGITTNNHGSEPREFGGDMGGQVFTVQSEMDYADDAIAAGTCSEWTITNQSCEQIQYHQ